MAILKNRTQGNFTLISNGIFHDSRLKLIDRGLLCTIISLPDGWNFSIRGLAAILPDGKAAIEQSLSRLKEYGYITTKQERGKDGKMGANIVEVFAEPQVIDDKDAENTASEPRPENRDAVGEKPYPDFRDAEKRDTENRDPGNRAQYNKKEYNTKVYNINQSNRIDRIDETIACQNEINAPQDTGGEAEHSSINKADDQRYLKFLEFVHEQIYYDILVADYPDDVPTIDYIVDCIVSVFTTDAKTIRVSKEEKPIQVVRSQFYKLNMFHVQHVLENLKSAGRMKNPRAYMLTVLYSESMTMRLMIDNQMSSDTSGA